MKRSVIAAACIISSFCTMSFMKADVLNKEITEIVTISPNPQKNGTVTVASNISETLRIYIFETDGTLVHQGELKSKQQKQINNLKKGNYVFDAFLNNEGVQHNTLIVD